MSQARSCLVVYPYLPHYRFGVFRALQENANWDFTFASGIDSGDELIDTIPLELLRHTIVLRNYRIAGALWQRGVIAEAMRGDYDAVIFQGDASFLTTWLATLILRYRKVPVFYWTIGWHRPDRGLKRRVRLGFYRLPRALLLYGEDARDIGVQMGFPLDRMKVIGNSYGSLSVRARRRSAELASPDLSSSPQRVLVGAVARLTPLKRFDMLIAACRILRDRGMDVGMILCGDGPSRGSLERLADESHVPCIFTGPIHEASELRSVYERLDVSVLPERAGLTVMQSLEHGTPVVTVADPYRQVPEFRAVRPGITGELYMAGSVMDLADAVQRCLEGLKRDPATTAANCRRELLERWTPEAHAGRIVAALSEFSAER